VDAEGLISNIMAIIRRPVATGTRPPSRPASTSTAVVDGFTHEDPEWTDYMGEYAPVNSLGSLRKAFAVILGPLKGILCVEC
jgi:hypothetical protein